jgi:hypothetical protein
MAFVPQRTDATKYGVVDGVYPAFGEPLQVSKGGFGVVNPDGTFEVLDALPLGRANIQRSVELGSAALVADSDQGPYKAGFVAVDFATADYITADEVGNDSDFYLDSDLITSDLT